MIFSNVWAGNRRQNLVYAYVPLSIFFCSITVTELTFKVLTRDQHKFFRDSVSE